MKYVKNINNLNYTPLKKICKNTTTNYQYFKARF